MKSMKKYDFLNMLVVLITLEVEKLRKKNVRLGQNFKEIGIGLFTPNLLEDSNTRHRFF
jgi:hypothetical protein